MPIIARGGNQNEADGIATHMQWRLAWLCDRFIKIWRLLARESLDISPFHLLGSASFC